MSSRGKLRSAVEVCADCGGHSDPTWASINRGILLCDECCSVHRSLGRHISQVKSLKKDTWSSSQLAMVHALCSGGANNIWEHTLLDPTNAKNGRRKPSPKDPLNPTKADFIRAKHQMLAFVYRPNKDDCQLTAECDMSRQLHSSVRTANVETSLRLITMGADPNYFHPEKGTRPIHVAAKAGQDSQVELLACYGADPGGYDWEGNTPVQYARSAGHLVLADRLVELQYELTDRLAHFVSSRKPDHMAGQHFIIPEMADSLELSEFSKVAKRKLQLLPDNLFEDLAMDIYDEVDRRHTDDIWLTCSSYSMMVVDRCNVPFLPVNPEYSSTRNQGRQKLARFNTRELTMLIIDILCEAKRRQLGISLTGSVPGKQLLKPFSVNSIEKVAISDDEPLYDSVASDDECPPAIPRCVPQQDRTEMFAASHATASQSESVNKHLALAEARIQQLLDSNKGMKNEIANLNLVVQRLIQENGCLRSQVHSVMVSSKASVPNGHETNLKTPSCGGTRGEVTQRSLKLNQRPQSMYEPREQVRQQDSCGDDRQNSYRRSNDCNVNVHNQSNNSSQLALESWNVNTQNQMMKSQDWNRSSRLVHSDSTSSYSHNYLPSQNEALSKTKPITKRIQELHSLAREQRHESYVNCAEKIHAAVLEMAGIFPENAVDAKVQAALTELTNSALRLHTQTKHLVNPRDQPLDHSFIAQEIVKCAYDTTKAVKALVTLLE